MLKADHRGPSKTLQQNTDTNNENLGLSFFLLELSKNKSFHCFIFFNLYLKTYTVVLTQRHTITHTTRSELSTAVEKNKENNNNKTTHTHTRLFYTGPHIPAFPWLRGQPPEQSLRSSGETSIARLTTDKTTPVMPRCLATGEKKRADSH